MVDSLQEIVALIQSNEKVMIEQLYQFCEINSGSENIKGLDHIARVLQQAFTPLADEIQCVKFPPIPIITMSGLETEQAIGNALFIRKRPELKRRILLTGHMDTVYSEHSPFQSLTQLDNNTINGPGVADMKGGLIVMLHALAGFETSAFANNLGWDVLINADEEIGSPASSNLLEKISKQYQAALVYEPAMTSQGTLAKNRKGSGKFTIIATGKAAHAGRAFDEGRNAICHLAEALLKIHALNGQQNGVTINIGKIAGGNALNSVPDKAVAKLDVRISQPAHERWVLESLNSITNQLKKEGYSLSIQGKFGRPVKRINLATQKLFERIQTVGMALGLSLNWQDSGGCCDGNNLAQHGLPVIDTLGVRGGNIHTPQEYILLDSLVERAALSALILNDLAKGGLEKLTEDQRL